MVQCKTLIIIIVYKQCLLNIQMRNEKKYSRNLQEVEKVQKARKSLPAWLESADSNGRIHFSI